MLRKNSIFTTPLLQDYGSVVDTKSTQSVQAENTLKSIEGIKKALEEIAQKLRKNESTVQAVHSFSQQVSIYCNNIQHLYRSDLPKLSWEAIKSFALEVDLRGGISEKIQQLEEYNMGYIITSLAELVRKENSAFLYSKDREKRPAPTTLLKR